MVSSLRSHGTKRPLETDSLYTKLQKTDFTNSEDVRKHLSETSPYELEATLDLASRQDYELLHSVNKFVNDKLDLTNRKERQVNRVVKKYPDCLVVDQFLSPRDFTKVKAFLDKHPENTSEKRENVFYHEATVSMKSAGSVKVKVSDEARINKNAIGLIDKVDKENEKWIRNAFKKAMMTAFQFDGEKAFGIFRGVFMIGRDKESETTDEPVVFSKMHHDFSYSEDGKPDKFPEYLCLSMLSDSQAKEGWEGGNLIIQKDVTSRPHVQYDSSLKHIRYSYPVNKAICVHNLEVVHQREEIKGIHDIRRDLLILQLFRMNPQAEEAGTGT